MKGSLHLTNFTAGELSPELHGRSDISKYKNGLSSCLNWIPTPYGPIIRRKGTVYIYPAKNASKAARLIPFQYSVTQTYCLELGDLYIRVFKDSGIVLDGTSPVEIVSPYTEAQLDQVMYEQTADTIYFFHPDVAPYRLMRFSHTIWVMEQVPFEYGPFLSQNASSTTINQSASTGSITLTVTSSLGSELVTNGAFATAASWTWGAGWVHDGVGLEADATGSSTGTLSQTITITPNRVYVVVLTMKNRSAGSITVTLGGKTSEFTPNSNRTWSLAISTVKNEGLVIGRTADWDGSIDDVSVKLTADGYVSDVFRPGHVGSMWGFKPSTAWGFVQITSVTDSFAAAGDVKKTLVSAGATTNWMEGAFSTDRGFPACGSFFDQRFIMGGTNKNPTSFYASKSADILNFIPGTDDDSPLNMTMVTAEINRIRWIKASKNLMIGTAGNEIKVSANVFQEALTPTNIRQNSESNAGSASIQPVLIGDIILFMQRHRKKLMELSYNINKDGYSAAPSNLLSEHILEAKVKTMAFQKEPIPVVWLVLDDGKLVSLTYMRDMEVIGWARHETDGLFKGVAVIPGTTYDDVWFLVSRGGVMLVEKLSDLEAVGTTVAICVDSALTYSGSAVNVVSGLSHLEGKEVDVVSNGAYHPRRTVSGGQITLEAAATSVIVGLPISNHFATLPLDFASIEGVGYGKTKRVHKLRVNVKETISLEVGATLSSMWEIIRGGPNVILGDPPVLVTDIIEHDHDADYGEEGIFYVRANLPFAAEVRNIVIQGVTFES